MRIPTVLALLTAACAAPAPPVRPLATDWPERPDPATMPAAADLLSGFATVEERPAGWRRGDTVLFGLELHEGDRRRRWLLRLEVVTPHLRVRGRDGVRPARREISLDVKGGRSWTLESGLMAVSVAVFAEDGTGLGRSLVKLPREVLGKGFAHACRNAEAIAGDHRPGTLSFRDEELEGIASLLALLEVVEQDPTLSAILWEVVETPSLWSVMTHLGVDLSLKVYFLHTQRIEDRPRHLPDSGPTWAFPLRLEANGEPVLDAELLVTSPHPPLALCGGIVGLRARHPTDDALHLTMTVLAARRGPAPTHAGSPSPGAAFER